MVNQLRKRFFSPCLEMRPKESTMGTVLSVVIGDPFDKARVLFRGKEVCATCAHPEISAGQRVNMVERPAGIWWATCFQPSWYRQPIAEMIDHGRPYQAAMEYLVRNNPPYYPPLILKDKRGQNPTTPDVSYTPDSWPYDPVFFDAADLNHDGVVDGNEFLRWFSGFDSDLSTGEFLGDGEGTRDVVAKKLYGHTYRFMFRGYYPDVYQKDGVWFSATGGDSVVNLKTNVTGQDLAISAQSMGENVYYIDLNIAAPHYGYHGRYAVIYWVWDQVSEPFTWRDITLFTF